MLKITKKNVFPFEWRLRILVLGLCMISFLFM